MQGIRSGPGRIRMRPVLSGIVLDAPSHPGNGYRAAASVFDDEVFLDIVHLDAARTIVNRHAAPHFAYHDAARTIDDRNVASDAIHVDRAGAVIDTEAANIAYLYRTGAVIDQDIGRNVIDIDRS